MKRFITLLLMVTTLLTFTQKVMAIAPVLESETPSPHYQGMQMSADEMHCNGVSASMEHCHSNANAMVMNCLGENVNMDNCPSNCEMMTVVSVLHFIEDDTSISFAVSQLNYARLTSPAAYYYPETLYRPPFIS